MEEIAWESGNTAEAPTVARATAVAADGKMEEEKRTDLLGERLARSWESCRESLLSTGIETSGGGTSREGVPRQQQQEQAEMAVVVEEKNHGSSDNAASASIGREREEKKAGDDEKAGNSGGLLTELDGVWDDVEYTVWQALLGGCQRLDHR